MICPHKEGFDCCATAAIIIDGRCQHCCPYAVQFYNNPYDGFGRSLGYRIEILAPKAAIL